MKNLLTGGKKQRTPMKRRTSMSEVTFDINNVFCSNSSSDSDSNEPPPSNHHHHPIYPEMELDGEFGVHKQLEQRFLTAASRPTRARRASADFLLETRAAGPHFLNCCTLCSRPLMPSRDVYMYRGDSAFCSLECRQQQMHQDEKRERRSLIAAKKKSDSVTTTATATAASQS